MVNDSTFLLRETLWVSPVLFLPRSEDPVEDDTAVVDQGGYEEYILPLLAGLTKEISGYCFKQKQRLTESPKFLHRDKNIPKATLGFWVDI